MIERDIKMGRRIMNALMRLHDIVFPRYRTLLEEAVEGCESLLDVGCGKDSPVRSFAHTMHCVGVDIFTPALEQSKESRIHNEYRQMDVREIGSHFEPSSFDCVLASDLVEHLEKEDGLNVIDAMERIARKRVIVFTPCGFLKQDGYEENPWQEHKSGWSVEEMRARGYKVIGINGWKRIWDIPYLWKRLEGAPLHVRIIRRSLIDLTGIYTRWFPTHAFQMLCIKEQQK